MRAIHVKDLTDQIGTIGPRPFLVCPLCRDRFSANRGDYFLLSPDTLMECMECGVPLMRVTAHTELREA